ncbi:hypothetical protein P3W85_28180 [Cupriavidus basilensis]|uniref:Single-stranded DNA-binding protein n=1 Tax=Cupriavidus basilensis TaxID=68895 RepID=A0ABT6AW03_9BURK|nr:hypothetical protein [Cupriavidus basilensis]MDF3836805.1 hypothetical protein [Cupriavidus basilensis]
MSDAKEGRLRTTKVWRLRTAPSSSDFAKASFPYQIDVEVKEYHADGSYFEAQYQGVSVGVPMAPAHARRLDGQTKLTVQGQLRVLDDDFVIMRNASDKTADGTTIPVPETKVPARCTPTVASSAALKGGDLGGSTRFAGAGAGSGGVLASKTGGSCTR